MVQEPNFLLGMLGDKRRLAGGATSSFLRGPFRGRSSPCGLLSLPPVLI